MHNTISTSVKVMVFTFRIFLKDSSLPRQLPWDTRVHYCYLQTFHCQRRVSIFVMLLIRSSGPAALFLSRCYMEPNTDLVLIFLYHSR